MLSYNEPKNGMTKAIIQAAREKDHLDGRYTWTLYFSDDTKDKITADEVDVNQRGDLIFFDYYDNELVPVACYATGTWTGFFLSITVEEEKEE